MNGEEFVDYVYSFYGPGGLYDMGVTKNEIALAMAVRIAKLDAMDLEFVGDSFDREAIRDIIIKYTNRKFPS